MIKIKTDNDTIVISGHSGYDDFGKDIVCASVSSIAITTVNAILRFDQNSLTFEDKEGYLFISILKHSKETDLLINNMMDLFRSLEKKYSKNIKIN